MATPSMRLGAAAAALACAGFAASAQAADIEMFGFFDQGIAYVHEDLNAGMASPAGQGSANILDDEGYVARAGKRTVLQQGTGNVSTWGLKGAEVLNDDLKVVFHLESGFLADDGSIYGGKNQIFERESTLGLDSKTWGQVKFGRMPALTTGSGTTGLFNSRVNPFGAGWGNMTGGWKFVGTLASARHDNMINFISPSMNGVRVYAQYSFKSSLSDAGDEGSSDTNRWWAVGMSLTGEKYFLAAAVDCVDAKSKPLAGDMSKYYAKDPFKVLVGGHYDFDLFKLYGTVQYLKNVPYIGGYSTKEHAPLAAAGDIQKGFEAWAFSTGVDFKAIGGTVKASVGYATAENQNVDAQNKMDRVNVGLGYIYPLSKRTSVYGIAGYFWQDADWQKEDISANEVILGLMHRW